jgi:undecaprenyl-diphosphatase
VKTALLRIPRHWIVWTVVLFALTFGLGFAAKSIPALRLAAVDAAVNSVNSSLLDRMALALDFLDRPTVVAAVLAVTFIVVLLIKGWRLALAVCVVTGLGWLTTLVVKAVVAEPRPTAVLSHILKVSPATLSYPSGHVVFAAALVAALAMVCRRVASRTIILIVGGLFILLVAWSRLYIGVHFTSDVVGAILNGVAGAILFAGLWNLVARRVFPGGRKRAERAGR